MAHTPSDNLSNDDLSTSPWVRTRVAMEPLVPLVRKAAARLGIAEAVELQDPRSKGKRQELASLAFDVIEKALAAVGEGNVGETISFADDPEPYFHRARQKPQEGEVMSQRDAIIKFLNLSGDKLILSEADLVAGALRAAQVLNYGKFDAMDLVREGVKRVAQELISNAANVANSDPTKGKPATSPGRNWANYERALNELRTEVGTPAWAYRKPYISISTIAGRVVPNTNPIQIRRWLEAKSIPTVAPPRPGEDQTAKGNIVDPQLAKP